MTTRHDSFIELVREKLARFDSDIAQLGNADGSGLTIAALRKQRDHVQAELGRLEQSDGEAWTVLRPSVERAVTNLNDTLESEKARLRQA